VSYLNTVAPDKASFKVQAMYDKQKGGCDYVPNYAQAFSLNPELMDLWANLLKGIKANMDRKMFELVTFSAAHQLGSSYCSLAHGQKLLDYFTSAEVLRLAQQDYPGLVTSREAAAMEYARAVAKDAAAIGLDRIDGMRKEGFDDREIFDIASAVAARAFFTTVLDGTGTRPDHSFRMLDRELREQLTVGRSIETGDGYSG
jgi:uncharacterized peroxidase-related enzyme